MVILDRLSREQYQIRRRELLILVGVFSGIGLAQTLPCWRSGQQGKKIGCPCDHGIIGGVCLPPPHWPLLLDRFAYFLCWEDLLYRFGEKQVMLSSLPMVVLWKRTLLWFSTFGVLWCPMYCPLEGRGKNSTKVSHYALRYVGIRKKKNLDGIFQEDVRLCVSATLKSL